MKNFVKAVKKLSPKEEDIIVITLTGYPNGQDIQDLKNHLKPLQLTTKILIVDERVRIVTKNENKGKHMVYLTNLEYLEYLDKKKGLDKL